MIHREFRSVTAAAERDEDSFIVCMKKFQCEEEEEWMCKKQIIIRFFLRVMIYITRKQRNKSCKSTTYYKFPDE